MLQNATELYGHRIAGTDGELGLVTDLYFDDLSWAVRYLMVETGEWLAGRKVLISPQSFGQSDPAVKSLRVGLTRKQVEGSPALVPDGPVTRDYESLYNRYYDWPDYWGGRTNLTPVESHLRSTKAVAGYSVEAEDGLIGTVSGFLVNDASWAIRRISVATGPWNVGKEVDVPVGKVESIQHPKSTIFMKLTKTEVQRLK
jgi:hypothetical protein